MFGRYDVEQWMDFVQLTNRFTPQPAAGGGGGRAGARNSRRAEAATSGLDDEAGKKEKKKKKEKEQWVDTPKCQVCGARFWILRKRHHCRGCGRCVCWECSPEKFVLRGVNDDKPVRAYVLLLSCLRC